MVELLTSKMETVLFPFLNNETTMTTLTINNVTTDEFSVKTEDGKLNIYSTNNNYLSLRLNEDKTEVNLIINGVRTDNFSVNKENCKVYTKQAPWEQWNDKTVERIIAILAALVAISLPAGYLLSILSQTIYYNVLPESMQVHRTVIKELPPPLIDRSMKNKTEKELEPIFGKKLRLDIAEDYIEKYKWVQNSVEKRWDVLSINSAMIIATVLAPLFAFIIGYLFILPLRFYVPMFVLLSTVLPILKFPLVLLTFILEPPLLWFNDFFIVMIYLSLLIMIILFWSRQILFNQIVRIYKILLIKIK